VPGYRFEGYMYSGELAYFRGNQFIYIDDWRRATKELKDAIRKSLMDRAANILYRGRTAGTAPPGRRR